MGISAISWILQRLKEQAAIKQARDEIARAKNEELRTGRSSAPTAPKAVAQTETQALQDLAARRQAQLRELRTRQMQQGQPQSTTPPVVLTPPPARRPAPSAPQHGTLRPTPLPGGPRTNAPTRPVPRSQQPLQRRPESQPLPLPIPPSRFAPISATSPARLPDIAPPPVARRSDAAERLMDLLKDRSTGKVQPGRLLILGEILGKPASMRD